MAFATNAHDMPLFIDNYKPNTGFGFHDLVNLIHNILEGGEKDRLSRASTIKESRPVHCFPIITGEDVPDHDPATLARLLLIAFEWQAGQPNEKLALAQKDSEQLSAIGLSWLTWVGSPEGQRIIKDTARFLPAVRDGWALYLREIRKDMVNILRVATNIATNELTWSIAFMERLFEKAEMENPMLRYKLDTISIAFARLYNRPDVKYSLRYLCELFGVKNENAHTALADARALYEVYKKMMNA
jgi:hypothetical protein